jgi:hypothetical protein
MDKDPNMAIKTFFWRNSKRLYAPLSTHNQKMVWSVEVGGVADDAQNEGGKWQRKIMVQLKIFPKQLKSMYI